MPVGASIWRVIAWVTAPRPPPRSRRGGSWRPGSPPRPPGPRCSRQAIRLHIVPLGKNSAASWPSSSATRSCRRSGRRVLELLLVAHLRAGHRLPHLGRSAASGCPRMRLTTPRSRRAPRPIAASASTASAASSPEWRLPPPARASAWSMSSTVSTPKEHGTPVSSDTRAMPARRLGAHVVVVIGLAADHRAEAGHAAVAARLARSTARRAAARRHPARRGSRRSAPAFSNTFARPPRAGRRGSS